ncbi:hypothetical protein [Haloferula sp. BvORR071]|uniref:hypothetical protein n=1 Tax=Haloferula sp. BvORR071 TaxID=1396141 RepID=UPI0006990640|nr:hypothetical protein [Haloferula sp. BvORR071]
MFRILAIALATLGGSLPAMAALELARAPLLNATLPASSTWQVEQQQQPSGTWTPTGVLVGGTGSAVSVRLDGFPATANYRFQRILTAGTLTPTLGPAAWTLSGREPGATQVALDSSPNLAAWTDLALVYPDSTGRYLRALRSPELAASRNFFRAEVPALPLGDATVFSHTLAPNNEGSAGFGQIYSDMPQIFKDGFIGALAPVEYHRGGQNAAAAGECYELAGPFGRTTLMITDTTTAPTGTVDVGRSFFDIGPEPFKILIGGGDGTSGALTAGFRLVPAPVTGNLKLFVVPTSASIYYTELRAYNYRAGISKMELQINGSSNWVTLPRTAYNSFVYQAAGSVLPLAFPVKVRVTSRFDEVITFPSIASLTDNQKITGPAQFTVFPATALAPLPEHRIRPAYRDALTNVPGDQWSSGPYGGASLTVSDTSAPAYAGTASLRLSSLGGFAGATFSNYPGFARPDFGVFKFAIRSATALTADQVGLILYGSTTYGGTQTYSSLIQLPPLTTTWQSFQIPLQPSGTPPIIWGFQIFGRTSGALPNVWLDEISFEPR